MATATEAVAEPQRHVLIPPEGCECGTCPPTWIRRKGKSARYTDPVSLTEALKREDVAARPGMVAEHLSCLMTMATAAARAVTAGGGGDVGRTELGLSLLMFAGELAAAIQPGEFGDELPVDLVDACQQIVTATTVVTAGCLAGLVETIQKLSAIAS